ncbi:MAG: DUF5723 family protein [candidate division Zixibacteria bacterium]|nr:DUF5723 family protein [candidate division Zixibacteria bacterium]
MNKFQTQTLKAVQILKYSLWLPSVLIWLASTVVLTYEDSLAAGLSSARTMAMGGAFTGLASGVNAAKYNPANLGLTGYKNSGLQLIGISANVSNNSFTLGDYNKYTGAFLTESDKSYLLARVPNDGLKLRADVEATAMSLAVGSVAFTLSGVASADINLSRDVFDLLLNGNSFGDTITITGSHVDGISYVSAGLSYGRSVYSNGSRQLTIGITMNYLHGLGVQKVMELRGNATTNESGFAGEGQIISRNAIGGSGYAIDLGTALRLNSHYTLGAKLENLRGSISWDKNTTEQGYLFSFDTMTVDNSGEDYVLTDDYDKEIESFSTSLPRTLTVGFANTSGKFLWAVDWKQGLNNAFAVSTKPGIAVGAEWKLINLLPLRAGYSVGGDRNPVFSFGSGLNLLGFYLDAAVMTGSSFSSSSSKGAHFALSTGLVF